MADHSKAEIDLFVKSMHEAMRTAELEFLSYREAERCAAPVSKLTPAGPGMLDIKAA